MSAGSSGGLVRLAPSVDALANEGGELVVVDGRLWNLGVVQVGLGGSCGLMPSSFKRRVARQRRLARSPHAITRIVTFGQACSRFRFALGERKLAR